MVAAAVITVLIAGFVIIVPGPYATLPTCADILRPELLHRIPGIGPGAQVFQRHDDDAGLAAFVESLDCAVGGGGLSASGGLGFSMVRYPVTAEHADDASEAVEGNRGAHAGIPRPVAFGDGGYASAVDHDPRDTPESPRPHARVEFSDRNVRVLVGYRHPSNDGAATSGPEEDLDVVLEVGRAVQAELASTWTWF